MAPSHDETRSVNPLVHTQIGAKWALDLHFTLLLISFSMLILPFLLGCFKYTSFRYGHLNTTFHSWKEKEVWPLLLHFLAIWALEHHFQKLEGERSMVPSITLPGDLGTWTPLPKGGRRKKYGPFYYTSWRFGHLNTTSQRWKEKEGNKKNYTSPMLLITTVHELEVHLKWVTSSPLLKRFGSGKLVWMRSRAHLWKCDWSQKEVHLKCCTSSALPDDMGTQVD